GDLRRALRRRRARADAGREGRRAGSARRAQRLRRRAPAWNTGCARVPRRRLGADADRVGYTRPERHLLVSTLEEDPLARPRRRRPRRTARLLGGRRALVIVRW